MKNGLESIDFARADHARVLDDWKMGRAFADTTDCYGDPLTLKLGEVAAIGLCTPEGLARWREDTKADRVEDRAQELTEG